MIFTSAPFHRVPVILSIAGIASLITILWLVACPVDADWLGVAGKLEKDLPIYTVYVDTESIQGNGGIVTLWALFDYVAIQSIVGGPWLSSKTRREYDCVTERVRLVGYMTFTGNMGTGEAVYTNSGQSAWEPIAPNSVDRSLWAVACSRHHVAVNKEGS